MFNGLVIYGIIWNLIGSWHLDRNHLHFGSRPTTLSALTTWYVLHDAIHVSHFKLIHDLIYIYAMQVTSASDAIAYNNGELVEPGVALVMETMAGYSAYFTANDPRFVMHCLALSCIVFYYSRMQSILRFIL